MAHSTNATASPVEPPATSRNISVRAYRPEDRAVLLPMIERVWDTARYRNHEFLWSWLHGRDEGAPSGGISQVLEVDGKVVGHSGAIPVQLMIRGRVLPGSVLLDLFLDPSARGAGMKLMRHHLDTCKLGFGVGTPRARKLWRRVAGRDDIDLQAVTKRVCILDVRPLLTQRGIPGWIAATLQRAWRTWRSVRALPLARRRSDRLRLERCDTFPDAVNALGELVARRFDASVLRDASLLNWRYAECPVRYEKWLLWESDQLVGYVVYRLARMNGRRILLLLEVLATGDLDRHYDALLAHVLAVAERSGVSEIQTIEAGCSALARAMTRWGYLRKSEGEDRWVIGYASDSTLDVCSARWFLGAGTGDFEFVTFNQGVEEIRAAERDG